MSLARSGLSQVGCRYRRSAQVPLGIGKYDLEVVVALFGRVETHASGYREVLDDRREHLDGLDAVDAYHIDIPGDRVF